MGKPGQVRSEQTVNKLVVGNKFVVGILWEFRNLSG